jgi:hypoxanthine phosphoribosyltransferase
MWAAKVSIANKNVLVFDDFARTYNTITMAMKRIKQNNNRVKGIVLYAN